MLCPGLSTLGVAGLGVMCVTTWTAGVAAAIAGARSSASSAGRVSAHSALIIGWSRFMGTSFREEVSRSAQERFAVDTVPL